MRVALALAASIVLAAGPAAAAGNSRYCDTLKNGRRACYTVPN